MSDSLTKLDQIIFLNDLFDRGGRYTIAELVEALEREGIGGGQSEKTVYRLLQKLKNNLHAPLAKDKENRRYYTTLNTVIVPSFVARAENFHFIETVKNLLDSIKETPIYEDADKLFNELSECLPKNKMMNSDAPSRILFLGPPPTNIEQNFFNTIFSAMEHNYHIEITYEDYKHKTIKKKGIRPYQLIYDNGIWDLWGYDCINRQNQLYNLCRMKSCEIKKEPFVLPEDFDFKKVTPGTFGSFRDINTTSMTHYKILFKKNSYAESFVKDRSWGLNYTEETNEEGTIISFDNNQYEPLLKWLLGWGRDARPIEPEKLVKDWKQNIIDLYNEINTDNN